MKKISRVILAAGLAAVTVLSVGCGEKKNAEESSKIQLPISDFTKTEHTEISLSVKPETVRNSGMTISITNNTSGDISYGTDFLVEQFFGDTWYETAFNSMSLSVAVTLKPKETTEQQISFDNLLDPGKYRIIKTFDIAGEEVSFDAEFEVKAQ